jgi:sugar lactone lactonase YvrE
MKELFAAAGWTALVCLTLGQSANEPVIATIAGSGKMGWRGDGGPAIQADLWNPCAVAVDRAGNVYIADSGNARVRKVSPSGVITTYAGKRGEAPEADNIPASSAMLKRPVGVAVDAAGNLYIADDMAMRVRKVDATTKIITTLAGTGQRGFSGDNGPATKAHLNFPRGLAVDADGNLYIADRRNHRIRKVAARTGIITTVAGGGVPDPAQENVVPPLRPQGDHGPAIAAILNLPMSVAVDQHGNLYIADSANLKVRKVTAATGIITTVAGGGLARYGGDGGPATSASLDSPESVAVDRQGNIYIGDHYVSRVRKVDTRGIIDVYAGSDVGFGGDGGPARQAAIQYLGGLALDQEGNLYIADEGNFRIRVVRIPKGGR